MRFSCRHTDTAHVETSNESESARFGPCSRLFAGDERADAQQPIEHLARELTGVPHAGHLETRDQRESIGSISARVAGDHCFRVALGGLHIARLRSVRPEQSEIVQA